MIRKLVDIVFAFVSISNYERRATYVLLFFVSIVVAYYAYWKSRPIETEWTAADQQILQEWLREDSLRSSLEATAALAPPLRSFDPNNDALDSLVSKGVPIRIARNIVNYTSGGGVFRKPEDLQRLYAVDAEDYKRLRAYIAIAQRLDSTKLKRQNRRGEKPREEKREPIIDLNCCSASDLRQIAGIGGVLSERIIRYRQALGGFVADRQVYEVYGLDTVVARRLIGCLTVSKCELKLLNINSLPVDSLVRHPYIDWALAKRLVVYRRQHGPFRVREDLKKLHGIEPEYIDRLLPYLDLK